MEKHPGGAADGRQLGDGLDGADLVVGEHDADQRGVRPEGGLQLGGADKAVLVHVQESDLEALGLQGAQGVQDGVMLEFGGNKMLFALARPGPRRAAQGLVVGLAAAGGEDQLARLGVQAAGDLGAGLAEGFFGLLAEGIQAGGVAPGRFHGGHHGPAGCLADAGGGCIIRIDHM